jgi:single-strand DNA-binding protein
MSVSVQYFIGRLTKTPEARMVGENKVVNFTVAVDPVIKGRDSDFYNVVAWRGLAETCEKYLDKGRMVFVSGRPQNRSYEVTRDSVTFKQYVSEVVADTVRFLDRGEAAPAGVGASTGAGEEYSSEDDLPF